MIYSPPCLPPITPSHLLLYSWPFIILLCDRVLPFKWNPQMSLQHHVAVTGVLCVWMLMPLHCWHVDVLTPGKATQMSCEEDILPLSHTGSSPIHGQKQPHSFLLQPTVQWLDVVSVVKGFNGGLSGGTACHCLHCLFSMPCDFLLPCRQNILEWIHHQWLLIHYFC